MPFFVHRAQFLAVPKKTAPHQKKFSLASLAVRQRNNAIRLFARSGPNSQIAQKAPRYIVKPYSVAQKNGGRLTKKIFPVVSFPLGWP
jgi:hypothetical protein